MFYRLAFSLIALLSIITNTIQTAFAFELPRVAKYEIAPAPVLKLAAEPLIRIGLATNARVAAITTTDSSLVSVSPNEPQKFLATTKITVTARAYRPPEVELYDFEIQSVENQVEAESTARDVREATSEKAVANLDLKTNKWRVLVGDTKDTIEEANEYKAILADKGFEDVVIVTRKISQPSGDAVALSQQLKSGAKTDVRSLGAGRPRVAADNPNKVTPTVSTHPVADTAINPNLREVIVSGANSAAQFSSLKPVSFGSVNERTTPVRLNGKAYRGKIEVFVNSRGSLTVVNVVPLEDYLLGVVPNELGLPAMEAQKAQAIAARTYAVANINGFASQGFDLLPTVRSQVYKGVSSENSNGTRAVMETRGMVATYRGKPINAYYTSTCGGRTENSENIFDSNEPYLRGVECSLEGRRHFEPFLIKSMREPAKIRDENNVEMVRLMARLALNNFQLSVAQMTDDFFEDEPNQSEIGNWTNQLAIRFGKTFPNTTKDSAKPAEFARILANFIYGDAYADTLLSESDINYQLSFLDAAEVPPAARANVAILLRDGWLSIYPDYTLRPNKAFPRGKMLRIINRIYDKKKWLPTLQTGTTQASEDGKLMIKSGKSSRALVVRPDVFLFRQFGDEFYQVKETALVGGETVNFLTNSLGEVTYLEVEPVQTPTVAERMSPFTMWNVNLAPSAVQSRLARYVRGLSGSLVDVRIAQKGYSRRATDLEILTTTGTYHLKGGKIRSALRLREQLFVLNKKYDSSGRATAYSFTGRGWGHGIGMCQYGAFGLAKMGVKYDEIIKHYYTGVDLTRAY